MENKQTAVDFFFTKVLGSLHISMSKTDIDELLIEAKQIEKQQIINDYNHGQNNGYMYRDGISDIIKPDQYYNETYGGIK